MADGAKDGGGVGAHAAVFRAAPDALALVASALVEANTLDRAAAGTGGAALALDTGRATLSSVGDGA